MTFKTLSSSWSTVAAVWLIAALAEVNFMKTGLLKNTSTILVTCENDWRLEKFLKEFSETMKQCQCTLCAPVWQKEGEEKHEGEEEPEGEEKHEGEDEVDEGEDSDVLYIKFILVIEFGTTRLWPSMVLPNLTPLETGWLGCYWT